MGVTYYGSHWLQIFWSEPHPNYDLRTGVGGGGGAGLWVLWVGAVDIEWK